MKKIWAFIFSVVFVFGILSGCSFSGRQSLRILSGSENRELEPILEEFSRKEGITVEMTYQGSVEIMNQLKAGAPDYDAVWPANSIWISMGDDNNIVKNQKSVMSSPVVFGIKTSLAEELGFIGTQVSIRDILSAIENGELSFAMTSATQSNSGACAYMGFLSAMLGKSTPVTSEDLHNEKLQEEIRLLLSGVNRSSGSSDWLKDLLLENPGSIDAMVNYESLIISANKELTARGEEPLYIVYPYDGMSLSDSPLAYIDKGNADKEEAFFALQEYLESDDVIKGLNALGRRTGITLGVENPDPAVWNSVWGVDTERTLSFINLPAKEVIIEALNLYQTALRKPSATVYCLDFSGSMAGNGNEQLVEAVNTIFNQETASAYMLQNGVDDYTAIIAFSDSTLGFIDYTGNNQTEMLKLCHWVRDMEPGGGTDIYSPVVEAFDKLENFDEGYIKTVVLMTDGESNAGMDADRFAEELAIRSEDIPVFSIMFGEASDKQLNDIAGMTAARVFDGREDMISAFKQVRGYN